MSIGKPLGEMLVDGQLASVEVVDAASAAGDALLTQGERWRG
jgi:hypothetical protein